MSLWLTLTEAALARREALDAGLNPLHFLAVKLGRGMPLQRTMNGLQ